MFEIIPAILPKNFKDLEEKLEMVKDTVSCVQIDVLDGKFVAKASWPYEKVDNNFKAIIEEQRGMPFWEDFDFEIDMMVSDPLSLVSDWIKAGASRVVFHVDSLDYDRDALLLDQLKTEGLVQIGFAIGPDDEADILNNYFQFADFIQVMGISNIGSQGNPFDRGCIDQIVWIKKNVPHMIVSVDGGMNPDTIPLVLDAGADRIIVGSFIFKNVNPREAIEDLKSLI